ncbi:MAG: hypothetical protein AB7G28_24485 [Pirellulales bacterium]
MPMPSFRFSFLTIAVCLLLAGAVRAAPRSDGELTIEVVDAETQQPLAARMHLKNSRGRPVRLRTGALSPFADHFYIDHQAALGLRVGQYEFEVESGPEYRTQSGHFEIVRHAEDTKQIPMSPFADLAKEGWYGGDLDVERIPEHLPLAMRAESLALVANRDASGTNQLAGDLLLCGLQQPLETEGKTSLEILQAAKAAGAQVVARTPFAWDLPVWLASGELDAIDVIHHHALRDAVVDNEGEGRPREKVFFPGRNGNGRYSETIYHHVLNCGLRIPPAAGSGTGTNESPLGTNRVYVFCGKEFSPEAWWEGLDAGEVFITNGPLLRTKVEGQPPGYVFHLSGSGAHEFEIGLNLATRVPVQYLQIIKNGGLAYDVRLDQFAAQGGKLPPLAFDESGWFQVRAVTDNAKNYQFAETGPYYVERNGKPRVSRESVQFFLDWIAANEMRIQGLMDLSAPLRTRMLAEQTAARAYFEDLLAGANAD